MPRSFEEIVSDLKAEGATSLADELERDYGKSTLRDQAARAATLEKELEVRDKRIEALEKAPLREKAFREALVDFDSLRPLERAAVDSYDGELDPAKVADFIEANQLPTTQAAPPETGNGQPGSAQVAQAARTAPSTRRVGSPNQIGPDDASEMGPEKWMKFMEEHPAEADQILQGKTVTV